MSHVPAPLRVEPRTFGQNVYLSPRVDGRVVGVELLIQSGSICYERHLQWARVFLDACCKAPIVLGARV